jgi:hypothetical protein
MSNTSHKEFLQANAFKLELLGAAFSLLLGVASTADIIGQPARLVTMITLFFSGVGTGVSIGHLAARYRHSRQNNPENA